VKIRFVLALFGLLALAGISEAGGCYSSYRSYRTYSHDYYEPTYVVKEYVALLAIPLGLNTVGYAAPPVAVPPVAPPVPAAAPAVAPCETELKAFRLELERLRSELAAVRAGGVPPVGPVPQHAGQPPQPQAQAHPAQAAPKGSVLFESCAACHEAKVAKAKGQGFVMFEGGKMAPLTAGQILKAGKKMRFGEMPPPNNKEGVPPLTDERYAGCQAELDALAVK